MEHEKISASTYLVRDRVRNVNAGFIATRGGAVVVDTGPTPAFGQELRELVPAVCGRPIRYVINTNFLDDHTRGNGAFEVPILAHPSAARAIAHRWRGNGNGTRVPDLQFDANGYVFLGGRIIELLHTPGHSEGDVAVYLPDEGVIFAADNLFVDAYPVMDHGDPVRWMESLARLRSLKFRTAVPGHGQVAGRDAVDQLYLYMENLVSTARTLRAKGWPVAEIESSRRFMRLASGVQDPLHRRNIRRTLERIAAE